MSSAPNSTELATCRHLFDEKFAELEQLLADLPAAALPWKPFETSPWQGPAGSLGWLIGHAVSSIFYLLRRAEWTMGRCEWSQVDGDEGREEFGPANLDPAYLLARVQRGRAFVHRFLDSVTLADLEITRPHARRPEIIFSVRYDLLHALEHMSQHIGHAQLTRQLWALQPQ